MGRPRFLIPAASRRARIVLEQPVETPDATGGATIDWQEITTLWARIEARSGSERNRDEGVEGRIDTRITLRWRGGLDGRMRFRLDTRLFAIRAAFDPDGRRRDLVCLCEEVTP